jgi:hypothetical protein
MLTQTLCPPWRGESTHPGSAFSPLFNQDNFAVSLESHAELKNNSHPVDMDSRASASFQEDFNLFKGNSEQLTASFGKILHKLTEQVHRRLVNNDHC